MKDSNDLNFFLRDWAKENYMTTGWEFPVSFLDGVAGNSRFGIARKYKEGIIELFRVEPSLLLSPLALGVGRYRFEVSPGSIGEGICSH